MKQSKTFFKNALYLTITELLLRTAGVFFGAYISGKMGGSGMGLFSLIMSVYSFAVTFASSGINLACVRLTAEASGRGSDREIRAVLKICIIYSLIFGFLGCGALYFGADFLGGVFLGDIRTVPALRLLAFSLPPLAVSNALNGYFISVGRVYKSSVCRIAEEFSKIIPTVLGFSVFLPLGAQYGCMVLAASTVFSEALSFLIALILCAEDLRRHNDNSGEKGTSLTSNLCRVALPVAFGSYFRSFLITSEHAALPRGLKKYGSSPDKSLASYGIFHGMAMPLVLYPAAFLGAFSSLLVPETAREIAGGNKEKASRISSRALKFALLFSIGSSCFFLAFASPLGEAFYKSAECGFYIRIMAPLIPVMYLDGVADSLLKGMDFQFYSMCVNIIDASLSLFLVTLLVPRMGIAGYILTVFVSEILNFALSISKLIKHNELNLGIADCLIKPVMSGAAAALITRLLRCGLAVNLLVFLFLYIILLVFSSAVTRRDASDVIGHRYN